MSAGTITRERRELAARAADGMMIRLLWNGQESGSRVWVEVDDVRTGVTFVTEIRPEDNPMDVFWHPFAYSTRVKA